MSEIEHILPHRPPFLFVDTVLEFQAGASVVTEKYLSGKEPFFQGHFPGHPVMPGVLVVEALAQSSGLLVGLTAMDNGTIRENPPAGLVLANVDMKFPHPLVPAATLRMTSELSKHYGNLYRFRVEAACGDKIIATGLLSLGAAT